MSSVCVSVLGYGFAYSSLPAFSPSTSLSFSYMLELRRDFSGSDLLSGSTRRPLTSTDLNRGRELAMFFLAIISNGRSSLLHQLLASFPISESKGNSASETSGYETPADQRSYQIASSAYLVLKMVAKGLIRIHHDFSAPDLSSFIPCSAGVTEDRFLSTAHRRRQATEEELGRILWWMLFSSWAWPNNIEVWSVTGPLRRLGYLEPLVDHSPIAYYSCPLSRTDGPFPSPYKPRSDLIVILVNSLTLLSRNRYSFGRGLHGTSISASAQESSDLQSLDPPSFPARPSFVCISHRRELLPVLLPAFRSQVLPSQPRSSLIFLVLTIFSVYQSRHHSCLGRGLLSKLVLILIFGLVNTYSRAARSRSFFGITTLSCCVLPLGLVKGNASLLVWAKPVHWSNPFDWYPRLSDLEGPCRPSVATRKKSSLPLGPLCFSPLVSCWPKALLLCRFSLSINFYISVAGSHLAGFGKRCEGFRRLYSSIRYEFMVIFAASVTGIMFTGLVVIASPSSSLGERSFSPLTPPSSGTKRLLQSPSSSLEQNLLSFVMVAKLLALRAFVDHLVAVGIKKVVSPTSDKEFTPGTLSLDSWILIFPLKFKDVTSCCNSLGSMLLACLWLKIVFAFYLSSPSVWVWLCSSYVELFQV